MTDTRVSRIRAHAPHIGMMFLGAGQAVTSVIAPCAKGVVDAALARPRTSIMMFLDFSFFEQLITIFMERKRDYFPLRKARAPAKKGTILPNRSIVR